MADHSPFVAAIPIIITSVIVTSWMMARNRKTLEKEIRKIFQDKFPALTLVSIDAAKIVVRLRGRNYPFPAKALMKEIGRRKPDIGPILESELLQATKARLGELSEKPLVPSVSISALEFENMQTQSAAPTHLQCALCSKTLRNQYFEVNGEVSCETCKDKRSAFLKRKSDWRSVLHAILYGAGAAVLGCLLYYAVRRITGYELGLIAIVVGLMVGGAVHRASQGRGGALYQTIAIFLTYSAIVFNYTPDLFQAITTPLSGLAPGIEMAIRVVWLTAVIFAIPFLSGLENLIGLLIIGFALYEAWKLNKRPVLTIAGPFRANVASMPAVTDSSPSPIIGA